MELSEEEEEEKAKMGTNCDIAGDAEQKWIKHYSSSHRILLVGEGDFSFAACLAKAFGSAVNIIATSLDSKEEVIGKYPSAASYLKELNDLGCTIEHEVDAHTMSGHPILNQKCFDRIVFNFPHAGLIWPWQEHWTYQIELHQKLVKGFLRSARDMVADDGEVHVTHKISHPFSKWDIERLAEDVGLCLVEKVAFQLWDYPGYINKRGYASGSRVRYNMSFPVGQCSTFKFCKTLA